MKNNMKKKRHIVGYFFICRYGLSLFIHAILITYFIVILKKQPILKVKVKPIYKIKTHYFQLSVRKQNHQKNT